MKIKGLIPSMVVILLSFMQSLGSTQIQTNEEQMKRAREEGRQAAAKALKRGELIYHIGGPPASWDERFGQILWDEYKIRLRHIGCDSNDEQFQRGVGANEVMQPAIGEKYGREMLGRVEERAKRETKGSEAGPER